jgi:LuxR family transcriptional regulator, maltose regulon positive regulatory protein
VASPRISTWLERPRLRDALRSDAPLVALVGGRGTGKTALLQRWAQESAGAWVVAGEPVPASDALVVDDAASLGPEEWTALARELSARPRLRVRLAARSLSELPLEWDVEVVRELTFTLTETRAYVALRAATIDPVAAYLATAGVADLLRLVVQSGATRPPAVEAILASAATRRALPERMRDAAVPALLSAPFAERLGVDGDRLARLERDGDGWWVPDAAGEVFVLSPAVRAATLARHPLPAEERRRIRDGAAEALAAEGAWIAALVEAAAVDRLDLVAAALKGGGLALLPAHGALIAASLHRVAAHRLRHEPVVAMALAIVYNARRHTRARAIELFGVALIGMQTAPAGSADRVLLKVLEAVGRRLLGVGDGGVRSASAALSMLAELAPADRDEIGGLVGDLTLHAGLSLLYGGQTGSARAAFESASAQAVRPSTELTALGALASVAALEGDLPRARTWIAEAESRTWTREILDEYPGSLLRLAQAKVALEDGDVEGADAALDRIWPIIDTIEHWPLLAFVRAYADISAGRAAEGRERFRALRTLRGARLPRPAQRLLDAGDALLSLAVGDLPAARRLTLHRADAPGVRFVRARVLLADGQPERALRLVAGTTPATPDGRLTAAVLSTVIISQLGLSSAEGSRAHVDALRRTYGLQTPLLLLPPGARDLFADLDTVPAAPVPAAAVAATPRLTPREHVVLAELARAGGIHEVADRLHVSANTVRSQRRSIYRKLGAASREEAVAIAVDHGLLGDGSRTRSTTGTDASTPATARAKRML